MGNRIDTKILFELLGITDIMAMPDALMKIITGDRVIRDSLYRELLEMNGYDLSRDWFQALYEEELAQRRQNKQDFTPESVSVLCSLLIGNHSSVHEPTAGNGSMLISDWWNNVRKEWPGLYLPSMHMVDCWELSDRSIPILLLNLSIRGMMGIVHHGDVLENEEKCRYILLNKRDDALAFSDIVVDTTCRKTIIKEDMI